MSLLHPKFKELMQSHRGSILSASSIKDIFRKAYPDFNNDWVQPTDHCINKTNGGACWCAETDESIFEHQGDRTFKVR